MKRDLTGYGRTPGHLSWPDGAKIAVNFVINYEEGAELTPINGDSTAEYYGGEFSLVRKPEQVRSLSMESLFEYGSRSGIWRLLRLFEREKLPLTFFATGLALSLNKELCRHLSNSSYDIAGHGWRWIDHTQLSREEEKTHIQRCIQEIQHLTGQRIVGWYGGRSSEHTRKLLLEIGGFQYDSDSYADDLPYFHKQHLIIPYTLICNDFRFCTIPGFSTPNDFYLLLKNTLDYLRQENFPALMTVGLHPRISGHPGRCMAVQEFIHYLRTIPDIWITRRIDIAKYWLKNHKP